MALLSIVGVLVANNPAAAMTLDDLNTLGKDSCEAFTQSPGDQLADSVIELSRDRFGDDLSARTEPIEFRGQPIGVTVFMDLPAPDADSFSLRFIAPPMRGPRTVITRFRTGTEADPEWQFSYSDDCILQQAWQQFFDADNRPLYSQRLAENSYEPTGEPQWINPPTPTLAPIAPPRLRIGMIDSGVNYQLPAIANALARDEHGRLIGYDFWDMDARPFDAHPTRSPFAIPRHGTRTASIVIDEAPGIAIVPYRYPRPDMSRMQALVEHAAEHEVRIIGMPLGGNRYDEWAAFQRAAEAHPHILFIASAGNNGRDIDRKGVYPAALEIDNMLVVTSANDFVEPAERTNYGRLSVDYMLPAENISALDFSGSRQSVSGSSYAVSRLVALAARLLNQTPSLTTEALKHAIETLSVRGNSGRYVSTGYIGDPLSTSARISTRKLNVDQDTIPAGRHRLPLDIFVLSDQWQQSPIELALREANRILLQCDVQIEIRHWYLADTPTYLQNLSTGNALTLRNTLPAYDLAVFFADDTHMQTAFDAEAFGAGNTRNRPWMKNTLWITAQTTDLGIALAHELFHIMTNSGSHTNAENNLMRDRTTSSNTLLTAQQCQAALAYSSDSGLIDSGH
jgi:hypothetical protein